MRCTRHVWTISNQVLNLKKPNQNEKVIIFGQKQQKQSHFTRFRHNYIIQIESGLTQCVFCFFLGKILFDGRLGKVDLHTTKVPNYRWSLVDKRITLTWKKFNYLCQKRHNFLNNRAVYKKQMAIIYLGGNEMGTLLLNSYAKLQDCKFPKTPNIENGPVNYQSTSTRGDLFEYVSTTFSEPSWKTIAHFLSEFAFTRQQ